MRSSLLLSWIALASTTLVAGGCNRDVRVTLEPAVTHQEIDGFGTTGPYARGNQPEVARLLYEELGATILRVDLTPAFPAPASDFAYNSPWFHKAPSLPGPDGNNVRTYQGPDDYTRTWAGRSAPIVVMGPDIEKNIARLDFAAPSVVGFGTLAQRGARSVAGFKLIGSVWSPAPWLKQAHGSHIGPSSGIMPRDGTPFPFIWGGNFAGGTLDTSDTARAAFDDSALGGSGPTSALTQFTRTLVAWLLGFQRTFDVRFHAISLQNELNFETFYNSCAYPDASAYVKLVKAARSALDAHPELRAIRLIGPEDLLGGDAYGLWQYGTGRGAVSKNLQYLARLAEDRDALAALDLFAIHGYAPDGVQSAGADPRSWRWWAHGWRARPAADLPAQARGFRAFGKKSWMTETSGEPSLWRGDGEAVDASALGLALKIHQALTVGEQSAWLYWQLVDDDAVGTNTLTDLAHGARAPKYAAAQHYFRHVRPGARRIGARVEKSEHVHASAFLARQDRTLTVVLVHTDARAREVVLHGLTGEVQVWRSDAQRLHEAEPARAASDALRLTLPPASVTTLVGRARGPAPAR